VTAEIALSPGTIVTSHALTPVAAFADRILADDEHSFDDRKALTV
jgi:hypothetical protein